MNLIPRFLEALGQPDGARLNDEQQRLIESHLSHRLRQGFELAEVVFELSILSRIVGTLLEEGPPVERPPPAEIGRLFAKLNQATAAATRIFNEHLLEDEQRDKRYGRLIAEVARESLFANSTALAARMREVLELIMEAMSAESATLLLLDPQDSRKLIAVASAGMADETLAHYVASIDSDSFASRVAATEREPLAMLGVAADFAPVSETLRQSGIHSLLGVRLPDHHRLRGVLYIGLREDRAFTPSELRRLASLGNRLTLHLDNARLVSELRGNVAAIQLFIDVLAHDLRGPLTVAKIAAARLAEDPDSLPAQLPRLVRGLDRVERMVTDLLDAHLVQAGERLPLTLKEIDLAALVIDLADELNQQCGGRVVVAAPRELRGRWSSPYLRRAVWNLVTNGLKYGAPEAPVFVEVEADDEEVQIAVHNEGPPIPEEQRRLFFKMFARGVTPQSGERSWGLGLSLVRGAVEAHGGAVDVASDESGTTFSIKIPRNATVPEHETVEHAPAP